MKLKCLVIVWALVACGDGPQQRQTQIGVAGTIGLAGMQPPPPVPTAGFPNTGGTPAVAGNEATAAGIPAAGAGAAGIPAAAGTSGVVVTASRLPTPFRGIQLVVMYKNNAGNPHPEALLADGKALNTFTDFLFSNKTSDTYTGTGGTSWGEWMLQNDRIKVRLWGGKSWVDPDYPNEYPPLTKGTTVHANFMYYDSFSSAVDLIWERHYQLNTDGTYRMCEYEVANGAGNVRAKKLDSKGTYVIDGYVLSLTDKDTSRDYIRSIVIDPKDPRQGWIDDDHYTTPKDNSTTQTFGDWIAEQGKTLCQELKDF